MGPMLLRPTGKDYLWGGTRLKTEYGKDLDMIPLAETWECSTHKDGQSIISSGPFAGKTLSKVIKVHPEYLGTKHQGKSELPVLVKLIDARQDLSVQVHPDDAYAWEHEGQPGKTEVWYVLDARPGARIIYGFEHEVTRELLEDALRTGEFKKHLHQVSVSKGEVFYIPSGTVHAIGAGVILVEVQQSSNVTYRIYDYNRVDEDGNRRQLHLEKAIKVMNMKPEKVARYSSRVIHYHPGYCRELLCRCEFFELEIIQVDRQYSFIVGDDTFRILLCIEGNGVLYFRNGERGNRIVKGSCFFLSASGERYTIDGKLSFLIICG